MSSDIVDTLENWRNMMDLRARVAVLEEEKRNSLIEHERRGRMVASAMGRWRGHEPLVEAVERLANDYHDLFGRAKEAIAQRDALSARVVDLTALVEALKKYGRHKKDCHINPGGKVMEALGDGEKRPCSCGLANELDEAIRLSRQDATYLEVSEFLKRHEKANK